jgi:hypothetical protein
MEGDRPLRSGCPGHSKRTFSNGSELPNVFSAGPQLGIVKLTLIMIYFAEANTQCHPVWRT